MKPSVLIVDDSLTVRMDLDEALHEAGFETSQCASVATAREALSKTGYSVIILDVILPDGDGIDLLKDIKQTAATASIPVMLLSTEAEVRDRIRGLKTGAEEYIGKPYDTTYVVACAQRFTQDKNSEPTDKVTVLVIDDSRTFRESIKTALESANYSVVSAHTGEEGLHKAASSRPNVILLDDQLPGIDGGTVLRRLRSDVTLRHTPCLLLTASDDKKNEVRALEAGADAYVRKEAEMSIILARIGAVLRSAQSSSVNKTAPGLLGPKKVLAVDDSVTYLHQVSDQLREEGYDVVQAKSGEEALELLAVQPVDGILLDLMMPGLSGQETCKRIKSSPAWRDIPLIMLTALDENEAMIAGINAGADDYITKSGDFDVLKARLRAQLRRKQFEDENRRIREQLLEKELEASEARAARELAATREKLLADLKRKNEELESFSYSVSHDLRAPLRAIDGFSQALRDACYEKLDDRGQHYLRRIGEATTRMSDIIDALLELSRVTTLKMQTNEVDLAEIARSVADELKATEPSRVVNFHIASGMKSQCDPILIRIVLRNLMGNAWKYSSKVPTAEIFIESKIENGEPVFSIQDNGAGFDMVYARNLFGPFQRLHADKDFQGTGIGLATVRRIVQRHGGRVWAHGVVNKGATFYFTLPEPMKTHKGAFHGG